MRRPCRRPTTRRPISGAADQTAKHVPALPDRQLRRPLPQLGTLVQLSLLAALPRRGCERGDRGDGDGHRLGADRAACCSCSCCSATLQQRWIWLATGVYTGALALGWTNVNARYYMPIAFLITLGVFLATDQLDRAGAGGGWLAA